MSVCHGNGWASFGLKGSARKCYSDRAGVLENWNNGLLAMLADGHGPHGAQIAQRAIEEIPDLLMRSGFDRDKEGAACRAFLELDDRVASDADWSGTTLVVVHVYPGGVFWCHVGDSELYALGLERPCSRKVNSRHRADNPKERDRIFEAGGRLCDERVVHPKWSGLEEQFPSLGVTRCIGDRDFRPHVIPEPDCGRLKIGGWKTLILMSDGADDALGSVSSAQLAQASLAGDVCEATRRIFELIQDPPEDDATFLQIALCPFLLP